MGGGSSKQTTSYQNTTLPPYYAVPAASTGVQTSQRLAQTPYPAFPYASVWNPLDLDRQEYQNLLTGEVKPLTEIGTQGQWGEYYLPFQSNLAPLNAQQLTSIGQIGNWANNPSPVLDTAAQQLITTMGGGYQAPYSGPVLGAATNQLMGTLGGQYLNPNSNPFLARYAQQALGDVTRNYQNSIVPQLSAAATRAGAFGGSGDILMQTEAMKNLGDTLSKTVTDIYTPAYEAERNRQLQAQLSATNVYQTAYEQERNRQLQSQLYAPTLDTAYLPHYQAGLAAGDIQRQAQQDYMNELAARWQQQNMWPFMTGSAGASIYSPYVAGTGQSWGSQQTTSSISGASPFSSIMGGAMSGLGLLGSIFSDIRTKENMKPLEITAAMNPISFDYKPEFGNSGQIGFIADEIEKVAPGMVTTGPDGFKRIQVMSVLTLLIKAVQDQQKQINALMGR